MRRCPGTSGNTAQAGNLSPEVHALPGPRQEARAHGVRCLLSTHPRIRSLKRASPPAIHGTRQWPSCWILMDYLARHPLVPGSRVLEVGAGWGLAGIYCARRFDSQVVAVDKDPAVFPYLELHAALNHARVRTHQADFADLDRAMLRGTDVLLGSDICFWKPMIPALGDLIRRALDAGVSRILVADPGRHTFESLATDLGRRGFARVVDWKTKRPLPRTGRILVAPTSLS